MGLPVFVAFLCYYFLRQLKISGMIEFKRNMTDSVSLITYAFYTVRMAPAVCWNIMTIVFCNSDNFKKTGFYTMIQPKELSNILGFAVPKYVPILLLVLIFFNLFDVYNRVMGCMGFDVFLHDSDYSKKNKLVKTGKEIVKEKKLKLEEGYYESFLQKQTLSYCDWNRMNAMRSVFVEESDASPTLHGKTVLSSISEELLEDRM